jgi:hypothetical protein
MAQIPYPLGNDIAAAMNIPGQFYRKCFDVLIKYNGLGIVTGASAQLEKGSISWDSAAIVLRHIIYRTIVFSKPLEFIRVQDVIRGKPTIGIGGCGLGERTVARIFALLSPPGGDFLIKIRLPPKIAITPLYGLNLPGFLQLIQPLWEESVVWYLMESKEIEQPHFEMQLKSKLAKFEFNLLDNCAYIAELYKPSFQFLLSEPRVKDFKEFLGALCEQLPEKRILDKNMRLFDNYKQKDC